MKNSLNNTSFRNNNLKDFYQQSLGKDVIILGLGYEAKTAINLFLKPKGIRIRYIVDVESRTPKLIDGHIPIKHFRDLTNLDFRNAVILITDRHPYKCERKLLKMGVHNYFSSALFLERYYEMNNTNINFFYLQ